MTLNDDQLVQLLRDVPLPADPPNRYAGVDAHRRTASRRRSGLAAALATALVVAVVAGTILRPGSRTDSETLLSGQPTTARLHIVNVTEGTGKPHPEITAHDGVIDFVNKAVASDPGPEEVRQIGLDRWTRLSAEQARSTGKMWEHVRFPSQAAANTAASGLFVTLEDMRAGGATVTPLGVEKVRGVTTTRYAVTFDDVRAPRLEMYVGADGVVRKRVSRLETTFQGVTAVFTTTLELYDFGLPVAVVPPPADRVVEQGVGSSSSVTSSYCFVITSSDGSASKDCPAESGGAYSSCLTVASSQQAPSPNSQGCYTTAGSGSDRTAFCASLRDSIPRLPADQRAEAQRSLAQACSKG